MKPPYQLAFSITLAASLGLTATSQAATDADKCMVRKLTTTATYSSCRLEAEAKAIKKGQTPIFDECVDEFFSKFDKAESQFGAECPTLGDSDFIAATIEPCTESAADSISRCGNGILDPGEECDGTAFSGDPACGGECLTDCRCRFTDNGDGTVTDNGTALMWEKKRNSDGVMNFNDPRDVDNVYIWTRPFLGEECPEDELLPDGNAFTDYLFRLNRCETSFDRSTNVVGFAGYCDWRMPTLQELEMLVEIVTFGSPPLINPIFGPTQPLPYWTYTSQFGGDNVWYVNFLTGESKANAEKDCFGAPDGMDVIRDQQPPDHRGCAYVRAVRGGTGVFSSP